MNLTSDSQSIDNDDDKDTVTLPLTDYKSIKLNEIPKRQIINNSKSAIKTFKSSGLSSIGKCQRVIITKSNSDVNNNENENLSNRLLNKSIYSSNPSKYLPTTRLTSRLGRLSEDTLEDDSIESNGNTKPLPLCTNQTIDIIKSLDNKISNNQIIVKNNDDEDDLSDTMPLPLVDLISTTTYRSNIPNEEINNKITTKRVSFNHESSNESNKKKKTNSISNDLTNNNASIYNTILDPSRLLMINNKTYIKLSVLGKGGSSTVYRVISTDLQSIYAYKRVDIKHNNDIDDDNDSLLTNYINEINLLKQLNGSKHIIDLIDSEINKDENYIAMLMEAGDTDLAKVLHSNNKTSMCPLFIRMIWQEMLEAVNHIHNNRIVHGDLKPANFVFVKGHLKLIDFGIAKAISNDTTNIYRESQIGTVNYMAPEAISPTITFNESSTPSSTSTSQVITTSSHMKLGRSSDIWSLGCILYQIMYGKPPYANLTTIQKIHAISNSNYQINFPDSSDKHAIDCIKKCLIHKPTDRIKIDGELGLLNHAFLKLDSNFTSVTNNDFSDHKINEIIQLVKSNKNSNSMIYQIRKILRTNNSNTNSNQMIIYDDDISISHSTTTSSDSITNTKPLNIPTHSNIKSTTQPISKQIPSMQLDIENKLSSLKSKNLSSDRQPLKSLPLTLQQQILNKQPLDSMKDSVRASKWMSSKQPSPEKDDLKSILERRIGAMRKFLDVDQDITSNNDFTEGNSFF